MQNWFGYSDPGLSLECIADETAIFNFRRLLSKHELAAGILAVTNGYLGDQGLSLHQGTIVDATLINALRSIRIRAANVIGTAPDQERPEITSA